MGHPKFTLSYDSKNPGSPFLIREHDIVGGEVASRPHSGYQKFKEALKAFSELTGEPVFLVASFTSIGENKILGG